MILLPDNTQRNKNATVAFYVLGFIKIAAIVSSFLQAALLSRMEAGNYSEAEAESNDIRERIIAIANFAVLILCIVLFILWFRRAYNNLNRSGRTATQFDEGWAAGSWFVPFLNLGRPYQIMKEIWEKTQLATTNLLTYRKSDIVGWWWAIWILGNVASNIANRAERASSISELLTATYISVAADLIQLISIVLVVVMTKTTGRFEANLQESLLSDEQPVGEGEDHLNFITH
jgi:predicted nucleic acid-binding Zn ribbon protein